MTPLMSSCQRKNTQKNLRADKRLSGERVFSSFVKEEKTFEDENAGRPLTWECVQVWMQVFEEWLNSAGASIKQSYSKCLSEPGQRSGRTLAFVAS